MSPFEGYTRKDPQSAANVPVIRMSIMTAEFYVFPDNRFNETTKMASFMQDQGGWV
ncbi:hypothetical protein GCM10023116_29950 [Kistimonas scapharcae]|uniref:Uncharacterized protein n=1 Tax=Kistimonas scapharcae TaxID=1036133 RepID=A0ABP8V498_9GAMM